MTRETKVGLMMVALLVGVFGFLIYQRIHRPLEGLAVQDSREHRTSRTSEDDSTPEELSSLEQGQFASNDRPPAAKFKAKDPLPAPDPIAEDRFSNTNSTQWKSPNSVSAGDGDDFEPAQPRTTFRKSTQTMRDTESVNNDFDEPTTSAKSPKVIAEVAQISVPDPFEEEMSVSGEEDSSQENTTDQFPRPLEMPPEVEEGTETDEPSFDPDPNFERTTELEPSEDLPTIQPARTRLVNQTSDFDEEPRQAPQEERRLSPVTLDEKPFSPEATRMISTVRGPTYVIEPNDNFWAISRKRYGEGRFYMALARHNQQTIPDPKRMRPGTTIDTPEIAVLEQLYADLIPKPAVAEPPVAMSHSKPRKTEDAGPSGFFISPEGSPMYRIAGQDTLSEIAKSHLGRSSRWVQILEMNRNVLRDGNDLKIGTVLRLPADASRVQVVGNTREFR